MKLTKQTATLIFLLLLGLSVYITWRAIGHASEVAYSGEQPNLWVSGAAFLVSVGIVGVAIYIKYRYGK